MATCSFINATEARNIARNDTLLWTEICEVQAAILAAIDGDPCAIPPVQGAYSVIVAGGTPFTSAQQITAVDLIAPDFGGAGYFAQVATGTTGTVDGVEYVDGIAENGTGGTGAEITPIVTGSVVTSFNIDAAGSGYAPVSATAVVSNLYDLIDGQDELDYDNVGDNGTFSAGQDYRVGEVISLSEGSTSTVDTIAGLAVVTTIAQDETDYAGNFVGGDGVGGTTYQTGTTITMSDGSVITVDTVDGDGDVTEFTVTTPSTSSFPASSILTQVSAGSPGLAFTLTTVGANEISVGTITTFTIGSPGVTPFNWPSSITQTGTSFPGIGQGFILFPDIDNLNLVVPTGVDAILTPIVTDGVITNIAINVAGSGYLAGAPVVIVHPNGSGASAFIGVVSGSGEILSITITSGGSEYDIANALVAITHPTGQDFAGTVQTSGGEIIGISIQNGGVFYGTILPTAIVTDTTGTGADLTVNLVDDSGFPTLSAISSITVDDGGSGYTAPIVTIVNPNNNVPAPTTDADLGITVEDNTFGTVPTDYFDVLSGQATDPVIADQIQFVLDYFTALDYNIRGQVNPATANTMQWQIIW